MPDALISCHNLIKIYHVADLEVVALQGLDLTVAAGEMVAIVGPSGSGKTTLMAILGGLDVPSAGHCVVAGQDLLRSTPAQRLAFRRRMIGHIWQQSGRNLLAHYTLRENVELPQMALVAAARDRRARALDLLARVGLGDLADKYPAQVSGGEQQRAAIAIALANRPRVLLADELTGELDSATAEEILTLLRAINADEGITTVVVTHDPLVAARLDRVIALRDGRTSSEIVRRKAPQAGLDDAARTASATIAISGATHRELVLVDATGRLQIPPDLFDLLPLGQRVEMRAVGDHLEIWPLATEEA